MDEGTECVSLHMYDLTQGMAKQMSKPLLGIGKKEKTVKQELEGVWHTGIVLYGREYFFGGGIFHDKPGLTPYGTPTKKIVLGNTRKSLEEFSVFIDSIRPRFRMQDYNLLRHNCNNFTDECAKFLIGKGIPSEIIDLPTRALSTPMGRMLQPMIEQYQSQVTQQFVGIDQSIVGGDTRPLHAHSHLNLPLFTMGAAIAWKSGDISKAVGRMKQLLGDNVSVLGNGVAGLLLLKIEQVGQIPKLPGTVVEELLAASNALAPEDRYPAFDLLRIVCLHPQARAAVCESVDFIKSVCNDAQSKGCMMAGLRLIQNALLSESAISKAPLDSLIASFVARGLDHEAVGVRRGAAMVAYNLSLLLSKESDDACVQLLTALAHSINEAKDKVESLETLSKVLALGTVCYGSPQLLRIVEALGINLEPLKQSSNNQVRQATESLQTLFDA